MRLSLKILEPEDVTQSYVDWFADDEVVKYSENQYLAISLAGQIEYVKACQASRDIELFGIFDGPQHIGNIVIKGLLSPHRRAEIGFLVGQRSYWGKGVGSFAIAETVQRAKAHHGLRKLYATVAEPNIGSRMALERNGFSIEGHRKDHLFYTKKFFDQLDYGLILVKS